eukprot:GHVR01140559.1.p1 GENE.GHVR01140559.1~~GHVR01140559.1.p1  ORF type:complete len:245 (+),score=45.13 GHVR01140559.1:32-736(+)
MLSLYKNHVVTHVSKETFKLRQLELDWYENNFWTVAQQATIVAGFSFSQLTTSIPEKTSMILELIYVVSLAGSLCFNIYVVVVCTYAYIWAQGLALRGDKGFKSINRALTELDKQQVGWSGIIPSFIIGLFCFMLASFMAILSFDPKTEAFTSDIILLIIMFLLICYSIWLLKKFAYRRSLRSGLEAVESAYSHLGDLDRIAPTIDSKRRDAMREAEEGGDMGFFESFTNTFKL